MDYKSLKHLNLAPKTHYNFDESTIIIAIKAIILSSY